MIGLSVFGIDDFWVWSAYVLCLASTLTCVIYGIANWNRGDEPVADADVRWVAEEKKIEEDL